MAAGLQKVRGLLQELRFLHNPDQPHGFCGAALSSNVIHFTKVCATAWPCFENPPPPPPPPIHLWRIVCTNYQHSWGYARYLLLMSISQAIMWWLTWKRVP